MSTACNACQTFTLNLSSCSFSPHFWCPSPWVALYVKVTLGKKSTSCTVGWFFTQYSYILCLFGSTFDFLNIMETIHVGHFWPERTHFPFFWKWCLCLFSCLYFSPLFLHILSPPQPSASHHNVSRVSFVCMTMHLLWFT